MTYHVLARKWRPGKFADLVGQEHVVSAISNALDNHRLHHAYLFTGTRGVGKTTIARIFAKSLNCEKGMTSSPCGVCGNCQDIEAGRFVDLLEIDAASRTKVEDTRELLDNVQYKPTRGDYKVYLIDEVHMLSKHSFNALLKTLEEPPPHIKFLLATTDPQKLPITILSRCLQFNLKALTREQITAQLQHILTAENLSHEAAALSEIAKAAQGSMRDALSLTDQAIAQGNGQVSSRVVADMLGLMDRNQVLKLLHAVLSRDKQKTFAIVEELVAQAPDFSQLMSEMQALLHQVALTQYVPDACKLEASSAKAVYYLAGKIPPEMVQLQYQILLQGRKDLPYAVDGRTGLEMTLLRMLAFTPDENQTALVDFPFADAAAEKKTPDFASLATAVPERVDAISTETTPELAPESESESESESKEVDSSVYASESSAPVTEQEEESDQDSDDPMVSSLQQEAVNIMQQAEQLRDVSAESPSANTAVANQTKESVVAQDDKIESTLSRSDDGQDPYFHPEDLRDEHLSNKHLSDELSHAEQYPESDEVSYMDDLDQLSDLQAAPYESRQQVEDEVTSVGEDNLLDTHALLELHSSLQSSAQAEPETESRERDFSKRAVESSSDEDDVAEDIPENPFKLRASPETLTSQPESAGNQTESNLLTAQEIEEDDNIEEPIDFDVPLHLDGKKVTSASQLDTWSQLIEQAGLTGLPKQIVLHSNYHKDGDQVTLILNPEKQHLVNDANRQTIEEALGAVLQQNISVTIDVGEVKDTPYSVQKAINRVRLSHAKEVIHQDPNVHLMQQHFAASVIEETIKPR